MAQLTWCTKTKSKLNTEYDSASRIFLAAAYNITFLAKPAFNLISFGRKIFQQWRRLRVYANSPTFPVSESTVHVSPWRTLLFCGLSGYGHHKNLSIHKHPLVPCQGWVPLSVPPRPTGTPMYENPQLNVQAILDFLHVRTFTSVNCFTNYKRFNFYCFRALAYIT